MIVRILKFVLWAGVVLVALMVILFFTQMGDCPEKVIDPSLGNACTTQKDLWGWGSIIVAAAALVVGGYLIFSRRGGD